MKPKPYRDIDLHKDGKPLYLGDVKPGSVITFDVLTGEVVKIEPPRRQKGRQRVRLAAS